MANTINYATLFQTKLDKAMSQQLVTGWMESNSEQVIYNGGADVKIPKLDMDGLGNYDRTNGYASGSIDFSYETKTMSYDRGRKFTLDDMDVNETNFVLTASTNMSEFQRTKVVPEVDAIRLSKLAQQAITKDNVKYSFTPSKTNSVDEFKDEVTKIRDKGFVGQLVCHCSYDFKNQVEKAMAGQLSPATFSVGGIDTQVNSIDGVILLPVTSDKLFTKFKLLDGKSVGEEAGGFVKDAEALTINFMIISREVPIAISKTDKVKTITPDLNQTTDGYMTFYRKYHDIWVLENKADGIYLNVKEAKTV